MNGARDAAEKIFQRQPHVLGEVALNFRRARRGRNFFRRGQFVIVGGTAVGIAENFVSRVDGLNVAKRSGGTGVVVGMMLLGEEAVGGTNLFQSAALMEAECGVVVGGGSLHGTSLAELATGVRRNARRGI